MCKALLNVDMQYDKPADLQTVQTMYDRYVMRVM